MEKLVSIVIPVYNRKEELIDCLNSLKKIDYKNIEIIVVDNASTDETFEALKQDFSEVKIIRNEKNLMAVPARNQGLRESKGEYILFLDSDNKVAHDFLSEMMKLTESDDKIGFVGPKMYFANEPRKIWYAGADINLLTSKTTYLGINKIDNGQFDQIRETGHIPNCFLVKRKVIEEIGELDESYVMSYGEADFAERAKRAGFKIIFCPTARIWHNEKASIRGLIFRSPKRAYYFARNRVLFMKKFSPRISFYIFFVIFFPFFIMANLTILIFKRKPNLVLAYLTGARDGFIYGLTGVLKDNSSKFLHLEPSDYANKK
ncbi:MAG: hypothetical protein A3D75_01655 [Candidatus Levybacteria bacterium RIFCSPHIGHO2_02_FULL_37_18]|nr:MAG: hypothetical protein A2794_01830 [Alphaproteobacteria bacterium RIFCSPHIGHO2_01_FULL_40_8]OGH21692.1 MAG: hypothetical protein A3D75_01655 [Candidatus Levybacteria bacterium RIFCSPHIGHO2_02_FULL_37_18]OGH33254.1 MAG: hypothetical protein A3A47_02965 [Candidatus Levybacteria bacterium RIFCSPLOWO2_01_FULL_37_20]